MGALLIAAALGTVAVLVTVGVATAEPRRDTITGCNMESNAAPPAHTLILIDQTDALPQDELEYARRLIFNEYYWLPVDGLLTIRNIRAQSAKAVDIAVCRMPGSHEVNPFTTTPEAVEKDFKRSAGAQLDQFLSDMARAPSEDRSPILEAVAAAARRPDFGEDISKRRLVMLSDMIQNSDAYSHYGRRSLELPPAAARRFDPDLTGVEVRIHYVERPESSVQGEDHQGFWQEYFDERGASKPAVGHTLGLGEARTRKIWYAPAQKPQAAKR
ncbi:MAG TPA: hypothetical protein VGC35_05045 [Allosphingosinicella sp.]